MSLNESLARRVFGGLSLLFIGFIIYASWTPADDQASAEGLFGGITSLRSIFQGHNLRDIATNVLLYLPLGVFVALACSAGKLRLVSPFLLVGFVVSLTMELGQSTIGRTPDLVDLCTNTVGYLVGYFLVFVAVVRYGMSPLVFMGLSANDEDQDQKTQSIAAFRFLAIAIYVLVALLPLDVSVKLGRIYQQLLPDETGQPKLILDPLYSISRWDTLGLKLTFELWALLPIAALTAFLGGVRGRLRLSSTILSVVGVAIFCECAQVFIMSRRTDVAMLFVATCSGVLGYLLVKTWFRLQHRENLRSEISRDMRVGWQETGLAWLGYALVIGLFAWSPFRFELDIGSVLEKIRHDSNLVPFRQHFSTRSLGSAVDIVKEAGLFVPFGLLGARFVGQIRPQIQRLHLLIAATLSSAAFACFTEISQAVCIGRYIDVTDVFLGAFGGLCGAVVYRLFLVQENNSPGLGTS